MEKILPDNFKQTESMSEIEYISKRDCRLIKEFINE
jgi:hypothetical protein